MVKHGLDDKTGFGPGLLYGLQWWAVSLPCVVIMGVVASRLHFGGGIGEQVWYLQKLFAVTGLATLAQICLGHRLPLVIGPAAILLVALTASAAPGGGGALYPAMAVGGLVIALTAAGGQLARLRTLFTPRVVTVILVLIAFTLSPTILRLMLDGAERQAGRLCFAVATVLLMLAVNQRLKGIWKSLTVLLGLAGGSVAYFIIFGLPEAQAYAPPAARSLWVAEPAFEAGAILSFLFCFPALIVNELGSIESIGYMLSADDMAGRSKRGVITQGLSNVAAGAMGVIGTVSFSLSAGVIAATGCAARRTLIPAGLGLLVCAFFPEAVLIFSKLPGAVMGALMLYLMSAQLASGLSILVGEKSIQNFNDALAVGLPLMLGLIVSIAPQTAFSGFPELIRPIAGNGFIVGTVTAILLERILATSQK
ncbi:MAG: purine/pyrimidine permease [Candidatus Adiutrix sp.]|jgi:xanthine/uracil permease|nr:purine/pyrimidine permease [Candidatus Adiutrix sp.]